MPALLACTGALHAGPNFERLGPDGGTVRSLLVSSTPNLIYMGTRDGQIYKSTDGGAGWRLLYPGVRRRQFVIDAIVEKPGEPDHLFVGGWDVRSSGGGLYETRDGGQSWIQVKLAKANVAVRGFAISRHNPAFMIAGTNAGVFVTADGGKTWQQRGAQMKAFLQTESVAIDPENPHFLFVGTWHLGYRSTDFGKTWVSNAQGMIADSDVFSIVVDERNPKNLFASACTGLYRSIDHGLSWTRLKVFPKSYLVRAQVVYVDPSDAKRVYGGTTEGLFLSGDSGKSWSRVTPADWIVNAIQVDPRNGTILIGTEVNGIRRSGDGGSTWEDANSGYANRSISRVMADPANPGRFYVGELSEGKNDGLYVFDNPVNRWVPPDSYEAPGQSLLSMLELPGDQGRIAGTARGIFLRRPQSDKWTALPGPISKLSVYDLALDKDQVWVFAATNSGVYRSRIEDLDFQRPRNYSVIPRVFSLLSTGNRLFAATHLGVLRSDDSGGTWTSSSAGIPDSTIVECLVSSPAEPARMLAGTTAGLFASTDGGNRWARTSDGRLGVDISSVLFLDDSGKRILAADNTFGGVFLSADGGGRWDRIEDPQFGSPIRSLAQDPLHPSIVYLGTATESVYRLYLPAAQPEAEKR